MRVCIVFVCILIFVLFFFNTILKIVLYEADENIIFNFFFFFNIYETFWCARSHTFDSQAMASEDFFFPEKRLAKTM